MKKQILLSICIFLAFITKAQWVNIPDSNFGKWLTTNYPTCMQGNPQIGFQMDTTCGGIVSETYLDCRSSHINSLDGIQYFDGLTYLDCGFNQLTSLPALPNSLDTLNCWRNQLSSLPTLPNSLISLICSDNQLSSLPILPNSLTELDCYGNNLSNLSILKDSLQVLSCGSNHLNNLPALPSSLKILSCAFNQITSLPALPDSLIEIDCTYNLLSNLPNLPNSLAYLYCHYNQLNSLPNLPYNLIDLRCDFNQLTILPALHDSLVYLSCGMNKLNCLPKLPTNINDLYISGNNITCLPNRINPNNFDIDPATLPLCDPTSGCSFYYNISGNIHQKNQATCIDDSINPGIGLHNVKVFLKDTNNQVQQQFYSDNLGQYSFDIDSFTNYIIDVDTANLPFFVSCPTAFSHLVSLSATDSVATDNNFGLECNNAIDYFIQNIFAGRFRPDFISNIYILAGEPSYLRYNANCGNNSSGTITTTFSGAVQYVIPAPNALTPTVSGNTLTYTIANLDSLKDGDLDFILLTDTNAPIGSQVCITSIIHSDSVDLNPSNDTLTMCFTIGNSFDPNEKSVYPRTITTDGDWLTYTIQFQNTGNDTAYTIVVKDTLPQEVLAETFDYLASSHKNIIQIKGNEVTFTFPKINLVDSMTNEPLSHGWVQFKIKTKNNLPPVFNIANRAAIYFDFNAPIYTNYAFTTRPTSIREVNENLFSIFPNPTKNILQIHSKEQGEYTATIIDLTGRILHSTSFTDNTAIELSAYSTGIYSLILQDKNGNRNAVKVVKE